MTDAAPKTTHPEVSGEPRLLIDGKLVVPYWSRRTVSGGWSTVKTGDAGTAPREGKDQVLGLKNAKSISNRHD